MELGFAAGDGCGGVQGHRVPELSQSGLLGRGQNPVGHGVGNALPLAFLLEIIPLLGFNSQPRPEFIILLTKDVCRDRLGE